jgi:hypothetical protein
MEGVRNRFRVLPGGRPTGAPRRSLNRVPALRVIDGGAGADVERALAEAVEAARQMRLEIEQRIARELEAFPDRG